MRLVDALAEPAREAEFARVNSEFKSLAIFDGTQQLLVVEVFEYGVALFDLARPRQPQVERASRDARVPACRDVGLQRITVEARIALALVELFIDALEIIEIAVARQRQRIAIAQLATGAQRAVMRQEIFNFGRIDGFQVDGASPKELRHARLKIGMVFPIF